MGSASQRHPNCRTPELLRALTVDDIRRALSEMHSHQLAALHQALGVTGRQGRRTNASLIRKMVHQVDHDGSTRLSALLTAPVLSHWDDTSSDESLEEASVAAAAIRWGPLPVELALNVCWEYGDIDTTTRDHLVAVLNSVPGEGRTRSDQRINSAVPTLLEVLRATAIASIDKGDPTGITHLKQAVAYLRELDPECSSWQYLDGLLEDPPLDLDMTAWGSDPNLARLVGQLERIGRNEPDRLASMVRQLPPSAALRIVAREEATMVAGPILALATDEPERLGALLNRIPRPFHHWTEFADTLLENAGIDSLGDGAKSESLLVALQAALERWTDVDPNHSLRYRSLLMIARARCRRSRNDFAGALRVLQDVAEHPALTVDTVASMALERALAGAALSKPSAVPFPGTEADMVRLERRLRPVRNELEAVLNADPRSEAAHLLLGLLLHCEEDRGAAAHLVMAVALCEQSTGYDAAFITRLRFVAGLAELRLLEPGTANGAYAVISSALDLGYSPSAVDVVNTVTALEVHDSGHVGKFLTAVDDVVLRAAEVLTVLGDQARAGDGTCIDLALTLAAGKEIPIVRRVALLSAALEGADVIGDAGRAERIVYSLDEATERAGRSEFDEAFADSLATLDIVRDALGSCADGLRIEVLRRSGRLYEAAAVARQLFFRSIAGSLAGEFDAEDIYRLLVELGIADEESREMQRLLEKRAETSPPETGDMVDIRLVFVGGNETQERYIPTVENELRTKYGDGVEIDWFLTGWRSNWTTDVNRILAAVDNADAVVLMSFVRTHLGQLVRKESSERRLPWVACTGHGRDSVLNSLDRAIRVALAHSKSGESPPGSHDA